MTDHITNIIALIYEGPTEKNPWQGFATTLCSLLGARNVVVTLHHAEDELGDVYVMAGPDDDPIDWYEVESRYRKELMADDPYRHDRMASGDLGLIVSPQATPSAKAFMAELGIIHCMRSCFAEPGGTRCWVDIIRGIDGPWEPFSNEEQDLVRSLLPHLSRALALYAKLKRQEAERTIYESMVDHFALGCVLLNETGEVIHLNRIAATLLEQWPGVSIQRGRLTLNDRDAHRALDSAISAVNGARQAGTGHGEGRLVRLGDRHERLLGLLVHPAPAQPYYRGKQVPGAIVYLSDLSANLEDLRPVRADSINRIGQLFDLTRQESTLALLLSYGHTLADAAEKMGIAEATVRNYSKKIYTKLGVSSQTDLVRLMLRSFSILL